MAVKHKFNRVWYEAYDSQAKDALVSYLTKENHVLVNTEENYNVDIISQKHGYTYFNEAEVKVAWNGDWPEHWKEIRIPERKQRLLNKYQGEKGVLNFYVFRKDLKQVWRIKDTLLTRESLGEAKGRYIKPGELFFHIPYTEAELINLT
jgi:hypothetical protein